MSDNKIVSAAKSMPGATHAGGSGGERSGPTGSSRHYPKKVGSVPSRTDFNPQKCAVGKLYVGGV